MRSGLRAVGALGANEQTDEPIAFEAQVIATGARPSNANAKRELFTEHTQTVLVFEKGAVIRLSAAVADGQLLFLTNKRNGKEVVTQVVRKRSSRPTSCYVDLEFTEPCPGFWGIEFPKTAPAQPREGSSAGLSDEQDPDGVPVAPPTPPNQQEVERLKKEVAELQTQLKSLTTPTTAPTPDAPKESADAEPAAESKAVAERIRKQAEEKILQQLYTQEARQETQEGPQRLMAYPKKNTFVAVAKKAGKVAMFGAVAAVIVAAGFAAYRFGLVGKFGVGGGAKATPASVASAPAKPQGTPTVSAAAATSAPTSNLAPANASAAGSSESKSVPAPDSSVGMPSSVVPAESPTSPPVVPASAPITKAETLSAAPPVKKGKNDTKRSDFSASAPTAASTSTPSAVATSDASVAGSASSPEGYVAAKLIHAVRPVAPAEALRNYVSGNVNVDALVDTTGHVKSVTIVSGPQKLRDSAIAVMKQYVYEPARRNGKAVSSHVQESLQFWYEP